MGNKPFAFANLGAGRYFYKNNPAGTGLNRIYLYNYTMIHDQLLTFIRKAEIEETINLLVDFVDKHYTRFATEVYLIANRYSRVTSEKNKGLLEHSDYQIEMNSITYSLLEIIDSIDSLKEENFKKKKNDKEVFSSILELEQRFNQARKKSKTIQSNQTRLREKNDIARELGEIFINHPDLIKSYRGTLSEGIIAGIANRYKRLPEISGIDFFESVAEPILGNFTKCSIANALVEIIYTGQLQTQEDPKLVPDNERIANILDKMFPSSFQTVKLSITRVSAELEYFLGI